MRQTSRTTAIALAALIGAALCMAADVVMPQDSGPMTVDVSSYPKNIQAGYRLTIQACQTCHTLARVFNTTAPPRFWAHYLGGLQSKGDIHISNEDLAAIYDFLTYDDANRKQKNPKAFFPPLTEDEIKALQAKAGK